MTVTFYLTVSLPCILWYGNSYLEQWSLLDDLHFHTWTVMNCYRLWSLIIGVFIHMIRFIAMRDWGSCLNSMIIDMKGRTLNMISFFIAMIEKRKCNELLIIAMKSQISSMKTDTFISSWKLLWPLVWKYVVGLIARLPDCYLQLYSLGQQLYSWDVISDVLQVKPLTQKNSWHVRLDQKCKISFKD